MLFTIDNALLEVIKKDITIKISPDNIMAGSISDQFPSVSLVLKEFSFEEMGIGGSSSIRYERISETFDGDGEKTDFQLKEQPLRPIIALECPAGAFKSEPDDYTTDYTTGVVTLRNPPEKNKKILTITYNGARSVGEVVTLLVKARYVVLVRSTEYEELDILTRNIVTAFLLERAHLADQGITDIQFIGGYANLDKQEKPASEIILEYQVESTLNIEIPGAPMEKVIIQKKEGNA